MGNFIHSAVEVLMFQNGIECLMLEFGSSIVTDDELIGSHSSANLAEMPV